MKWVPHQYQFDALKFILEKPHAGIFLDPGMGKTSVTLTAVNVLRESGNTNRVLVIAPIRPMYKVWPDEIKKWDHLHDLSYTILHGDDKDEALNQVSDIYLLNPEGMKWFVEKGGFSKIGANMLVVDESTKFKDSSTARFKLIKPNIRRFDRRLILTGEPVPNGYHDLFGQMYIVDEGQALGKFVTHFRNKYFYPSGYGGYDYKLRDGADKEIQEAIAPKIMRLSAEDHLEMPELIFNDIVVELDLESMKIYKEFETEFIASVGDTVILTPNSAAVGSKCRQIANGGVYDELHVAHPVHDIKTKALVDLVEELGGQPLLIFYEFQHDLERIKRVFPNIPCLTGVDGKKLDNIVDSFNAGHTPQLAAHPASAGHGLNLQEACHHVCFYGLTWDLDLYNQAYRRVWRQGNTSNRVFVHRIIADKTLDRVVARTLLAKEGTTKDFLNALRNRDDN